MRLRGDVKIGAALSGGLDSSSIVSLIKQFNGNTIDCFSACFDKPFDEQSYIHDTIEITKHNSHKLYPNGDDLINDLKHITWFHDQPIPSASVLAQNKVFQAAHLSNTKVMLDGQGADEILYGYDSFYKDIIKRNPFKAILKFPLLWGLIQKRKREEISHHTILKNKTKPIKNKFNTVQLKAIDMIEKSVLPSLLHYEDRNAMMYGVESRVPFLDHNLVKIALTQPIHFFFKNSHRKYLLKVAVKHLIPKSIYNRTDKMAFSVPQGKWLQDNEAECKAELEKLKPLLADFLYVEKLDQIPKTSKLYWRILSFGIWRSIFDV